MNVQLHIILEPEVVNFPDSSKTIYANSQEHKKGNPSHKVEVETLSVTRVEQVLGKIFAPQTFVLSLLARTLP